MSRKSLLSGAAIAVSLLAAAPSHASSLGLDLGPGGSPTPCGGCGDASGRTYGWAIELLSAVHLDGLGVWDAGADGIGPDVEVGLWDGTGTLVASTTVSDGSTPVASAGDGEWLFETVSATLQPGFYNIGSVFFNSTPIAQVNAPFTLDPRL